MTDMNGCPPTIGDHIAYAFRRGNSSELRTGIIEHIDPTKGILVRWTKSTAPRLPTKPTRVSINHALII